ncbi:metallophosphoesterase [Camelimonas lactis]|uniref:Calcineurin-like phosphoesterase family protein n=1 Tax=Camelimonas lactis TaxID=659006 RepID=A0A4R2GHA8_9HYPH|nr:metallophosphoesterase [Camelimonas lactis]TCO07175.1 calcineurin-like phosphoesterase family protein [Camelimonas lactis]
MVELIEIHFSMALGDSFVENVGRGAAVLILHLSDIHFRESEIGTTQDPNVHLRNEIRRDVIAQCRKLGPPDVIIVGGDVAFAGSTKEFNFATDWLQDLCDACGGTLQSVFVCPGNHDVVRDLADRNLVQLVHDKIKSSSDPSAEIANQMRDRDARRLMYESLDNYNTFALQFFCDLLPPDRTRATRDLLLNDGSTLRLWGLNTAFISSGKDKEGDLFVDPASFQITRHDGVTNLVVAHHHLSWLREGIQFGYYLADVAPIQIFGHVHTNRIDMNVDYMRLTASAANPDRYEPGWEPGYNLLEVEVIRHDEQRKLRLRAHVRVWQEAPGGFEAKRYKGSDVWEHTIPLEPWDAPPAIAIPSPEHIVDTDRGPPPDGGSAMNSLRDLGLRFYRLSFSKKSEIAGRLELLEEEDMRQPDYERFRRVLLRANERSQLNELSAAVRAAELG